jgi:hypothetical protein
MHLTYLDKTPHSETPSVSAEGVGAPEIDITPEMVAAGVAAMAEHHYSHAEDDPWGEQVVTVYRAMYALMPRAHYVKP